MDFEDTLEEAQFRTEAIAFLEANAKRREPGEVPGYSRGHGDLDVLAAAKEFQAKKAEAGFAGISWPKEWGGRGGTQMHNVIYAQEEAKFKVDSVFFRIGLGMCLPTLCTWGTQEHIERYARSALRADEVWCQLFSEPAGGSDLAALRTSAVRDGDEWVINGQKTWTSGAQYCDFGVVVTRTDFDAPKHKGLTYFFLDMKSPGIEIKPIRQMSGVSNFNEVFFSGVRVPDSQRLGDVGDGWKVSLTTLMNERSVIGDSPGPDVNELLHLARQIRSVDGPAIDDPGIEEKIAEWYIRTEGLKFTRYRIMTSLSRGETPGPESSINKLVMATRLQEIAAFGLDIMGMAGPGTGFDMPLDGAFEEALLYSPAMRIAGGTDEVMRNIIAERVLGLPGDIRVDKDIPFNAIPTGPTGTKE